MHVLTASCLKKKRCDVVCEILTWDEILKIVYIERLLYTSKKKHVLNFRPVGLVVSEISR